MDKGIILFGEAANKYVELQYLEFYATLAFIGLILLGIIAGIIYAIFWG